MNRKRQSSLIILIVVFLASTLLFCKYKPMPESEAVIGNEALVENETKEFLGDESTWDKIQIELKDVQGLYGGRNMFISGSGEVVVEIVKPNPPKSLLTHKYQFMLSDSEINRLINMFIEKDFLTIIVSNRKGIPDESKPEIKLKNANGEGHSVAIWAGDLEENKRFADIYQELLMIEKRTENLKPLDF